MAEDESSNSTRTTIDQARHLDISTRRTYSKRMLEPNATDLWLEGLGYYRKHTPRDPTCLFRAISEQLYYTQVFHLKVRTQCIRFMKQMRSLFEESITVPFDHYLEQMTCFTEWGSMNEIRAMSLLYKRDVIIFNGQKQTIEKVTNNSFERTLNLCYTPPKQYESVFTLEYIEMSAYCQSIMYEIMYKGVFGMSNIMNTVQKMLHDRSAAFRHDRFFQRRNLDIREQLTVDLYNKIEGRHNVDEAQSDSRGVPPIPYKAAKALNPDTYRNTDFDIWHELRREVKYAGWNRHNSNELQVGGKCLINAKDIDDQDRNNNSSKSDSENNARSVQQKSKQENSYYTGYIQKMSKIEEPVVVFVEEKGMKYSVPYIALKPFPLVRKNRQNTLTSHNKKNTVTDARRWRKTYNSSSRKRKDTINMVNGIANNASRNGVNNININDKVDGFDTDGELPYVPIKTDQRHTRDISENHVENFSNYARNEVANNLPATVVFDNSQSVKTNSVREIGEERKKPNTIITKRNVDNNLLNKSARSGTSNNRDNSFQNSYSKSKILDENYYTPHTDNSQINMGINPNLLVYVFPDGSSYPVFPILSGNFNDLDQTDHLIPPRYFYNLGLEYFRVNQTWNYGVVPYGPDHHSAQSLEGVPANANMNNVPCVREDEMAHVINGMQNLSLTCNEAAGCSNDGRDVNVDSAISKVSPPYMNNTQNAKLPKQGLSKNFGGKDSYYQSPEKIKQNRIANKGNKGNKMRYQQNTREPLMQHWNQYGPSTSANMYDSRIIAHMQQQQPPPPPPSLPHQHQHMDGMMQQQTANTCASYIPPSTAMFPAVQFYPNDTATEACYTPYYVTNGFMPVTCLPPPSAQSSTLPPPSAHHDTGENATAVAQTHLYSSPTETYLPPPSYPSSTVCSPMMYPPPQVQFSPVLQQQQQHHPPPPPPPPPPPLPPQSSSTIQEHWYPMLGPSHYMQYAAPPTSMIAEASCNGQNTSSA